MTWVKLDDRYATHRKLLAAGAVAIALDVAGMCYCAGHGTDGRIPAVALAAAAPFLTRSQALVAAARLVEAGRWRAVSDGWVIHDFLVYNPSAAERKQAADLSESRRAAERERKRRSRERPRDVTPDKTRTVTGPSADVRTTPVPKDGTAQRAGSPVRPVPPDTPPPTVGAAADDDVPDTPVPRLSAQLRAEAAARTLADHGLPNGQPPPPATRDDVDPADFEAERRRQLAALKASESETP